MGPAAALSYEIGLWSEEEDELENGETFVPTINAMSRKMMENKRADEPVYQRLHNRAMV